MRRSSCSQMQQSLNPSAPTCVFVHGSYVGIDVAIKDANNTYGWIRRGTPGCPLNVIFFVWPGNESRMRILTNNIRTNGIKAAQNGIYLAHLIDRIPSSSPVSLVGHSHGARTVAASLHYRAGGRVHGLRKGNRSGSKRPIRVVFAAAAINHTWLNPGDKYGMALSQVDSLLNIVNRRDLALTLYPLAAVGNRRALAKTGLTRFDKRRLGCYACKVHELNASSIIGFRHTWPNYYGRPELARLISPYVFYNRRHPRASGMAAGSDQKSQKYVKSSTTKIVIPELAVANEVSEQERVAALSVIPPVVVTEPVVTQ